jgi:hypothetical protein
MDAPTLRLWPGVTLVLVQWFLRFIFPIFAPDLMPFAFIGAIVAGLGVVLWWLLFSRAAWVERIGAVVLMIGALYGTSLIAHESIATGAMGMLLSGGRRWS